MNIGNIVSTVQSEPLELLPEEEVLTQEEAFTIMALTQEVLEKYKVLENAEITQQTREDFFAGV